MASKHRPPLRLWLVGLVCLAAGATATGVFIAYASPSDRAGAAIEAGFVFIWYAIGLLLLVVDLPRSRPVGRWTVMGWTVWIIGILCCCGSVGLLTPE